MYTMNYLPQRFSSLTTGSLLLLLLLTGCATEDFVAPVDPGIESASFFDLKEETILLDEDTNTDILGFNAETGLLVYQAGSPQLDSVTVGSIILSRPNNEAEGGFLRKVTQVEVVGQRVVFETEPANLPDAFSDYRWVVNGDNEGRGRDGDEAGFSMGAEAITYRFEDDILGTDNWKVVLTAEVKYQINFVSELNYQLSGNAGITSANIGLDRFSIDSIVLQMSFERGTESSITDGLPEDVIFSLEDMGPVFTNLRTIALPRFPIDPPSSLVWVEPIIRIDISEETKSMIALGNRFVFTHGSRFFQGRLVKNGINDDFSLIKDAPEEMTVSGAVFFNGEYSYTSGISVGLGLAPYSRALFSMGARATVGPYFKLGGSVELEIGSEDGLIIPANATLEAGIAASAGVFLDANFFGLAPASWDAERTLWSENYPILNLGIDSGCSLFFNDFFANYNRSRNTIDFSVTRAVRDGVNTDGGYEIYLDDQLLILDGLSVFEPGQSYFFDLPSYVTPGEHTLRFARTNTSSLTFCERRVVIDVPDLTTSATCGGIDQVIDPTSNTIYCIQEYNNKRWFGSNLYALVEGNGGILERPNCANGNDTLCEPFGGLYDYLQLLNTTPGITPSSNQGLCPTGYHVPTLQEWLELFEVAGMEPDAQGKYLIPGVAEPFRAASTWGENEPGNEGLNPSANRFDAFAAGWFTNSSNPGYSNLGEEAIWWTSTPSDTGVGEEGAYAVIMQSNNSTIEITPLPVTQGNSCRCVEDN